MPINHPIPTLDASAYLGTASHDPERLGAELREALEKVGFYYLRGHGINPALTDAVFDECKRFHAQPVEAKLALRANEHNVGYMPVNGYVSRSSPVEKATHPNLVEAFFVKRERAADDPDVLANVRFRGANQWPGAVPGFRETVMAYCDAMENLCKQMLPVYAAALDLPHDFFAPGFDDPMYTLRLSHYPPAESGSAEQYGVAPHTDSSFLTMLAQSELPGLSIRTAQGNWIDAPVLPDALLVNSGDMLRRWTNHRFLSTEHRVVNRNPGRDRYAIPFFFDAGYNYPMECLATCTDADNPPLFPATTYVEYMEWFTSQYDHVKRKHPKPKVNASVG